MKTILFFIAGAVMTEAEAAALATLQSQTEEHRVLVRNAAQAINYGPRVESADFVAGDAVPDDYAAIPVWSGFGSYLEPTQAIVDDQQVIDTADGGTVTLTVAAGAISSAVYTAGV